MAIPLQQIIQVDGANDSSSDDDDDDENYDDYDHYPIGTEQRDENEADNLDADEVNAIYYANLCNCIFRFLLCQESFLHSVIQSFTRSFNHSFLV